MKQKLDLFSILVMLFCGIAEVSGAVNFPWYITAGAFFVLALDYFADYLNDYYFV